MFHNRIALIDGVPSTNFYSRSLGTQTLSIAPSMIMVPVMVQQAAWQARLYRLAYERALADLAPPRHHHRFFSVWN